MNGCRSILYFTNSTLWGGVEEHICGLLRNISRGCFACIWYVTRRFMSGSAPPAPGTSISRLLRFPVQDMSAAAMRFARLLLRGQFQIVHSHMFWSSLFASPIAWACRVPVIVETLHGTEAWRTGWKANCIVDRATTCFVSKYVAVCESDARFLNNKKHVRCKQDRHHS